MKHHVLLQTELVVHYENNSPFLTVTEMTRVIEVSHWGNIAVEETYDLIHSGAVLKGPFSRYDYQRHQDGISSVKAFKVASTDVDRENLLEMTPWTLTAAGMVS